MIESERSFKRIGYFIVIGFCCVIISCLVYMVGVQQGDIKAVKIEQSYEKAKYKELEETAQSWWNQVNYYKRMLQNSVMILREGQIYLKKGTIIIPPVQSKVEDEKG